MSFEDPYEEYLRTLSPEAAEEFERKLLEKEDKIFLEQMKKKENNEELYKKLNTISNFMPSNELNEKFVEDLFKLLVKKAEVKNVIDEFNNIMIINEKNYMEYNVLNDVLDSDFSSFWRFFTDIYETLIEKFEQMHINRNDKVDSKFTDVLISEKDYEYIYFAFSQFVLYVFNKILRKRPYLSVSLMLTIHNNEYEVLDSLKIDESDLLSTSFIFIKELSKNVTNLLYKYIFTNEKYTNYYLNHLASRLFYNKFDIYFFIDGYSFNLPKQYKKKVYEYIKVWITDIDKYCKGNLPLLLMYIMKLSKKINFKLLEYTLKHNNNMEYLNYIYINNIMKSFNEKEMDIINSYIVLNEVK